MQEKNISLIIQHLEKQLSDRLEKLWKVFNWSAGILIAITGGLIVLGKQEKLKFDIPELLLISFVIFILTMYAYLWILENLKIEGKIRDQLDLIFEKELNYPSIKDIRSDKAIFGYKAVILLLGVISFIAIWI